MHFATPLVSGYVQKIPLKVCHWNELLQGPSHSCFSSLFPHFFQNKEINCHLLMSHYSGVMLVRWCRLFACGGFLVLSGCYVNRALIDPWSYAPEDPYVYWSPDEKAAELACPLVCVEEERELPCPGRELSLAEVLDLALINNPTTERTWAEARQAAAEYGQSQSYALPTLVGQYSYQRERTGNLSQEFSPLGALFNTLIVSSQSMYGPQLQLSYTIFDFGQRRATSEAARYSLYYAGYTHNQALQSVLRQVTNDYYGALYQQKLSQAFEADLANAQETLDAAKLALCQGVANVSDFLQANSQFLQVEIQLVKQRQIVNNAYSTLLQDMGLPANVPVKLQSLPSEFPEEIPPGTVDDYIELAKQYRPDLLAARASVRSSEENVRAANREILPQLSYTFDFGRTYFSGGFNDKFDFNSVLTLSVPLFSGFWYLNNIKSAEAVVRQQEATLRQVELQVMKEIVTAHFDVVSSVETLKAARSFLRAAEEQYRVALSQYREGVGNILEVVSALSSLFDARAKEASAIQSWFSSLANLSYSTGTLCGIPGGIQ